MFCTKCGAIIDSVGKFCPKCGTPIAGEKKQQNVNEMEREKRISLTLKSKLIVAFIGVAAIIIIIIGVTTRDSISPIEFVVIGDNQQPDSLKDIIAEKSSDPFHISYTFEEDCYIAIGYGEQSSGGYSIRVNELYETKDALVISTTLIEPEANAIRMLTYPYIVLKIKDIVNKPIIFK